MSELLLENIETELFNAGLDFKRDYDPHEDHDYINIIGGEQRLQLSPLWSMPSSGDEDTYFFDSDDIRATLYQYGAVEAEVDLFPESEAELVDLVMRIFGEGVDFLSE